MDFLVNWIYSSQMLFAYIDTELLPLPSGTSFWIRLGFGNPSNEDSRFRAISSGNERHDCESVEEKMRLRLN